MRRSFFSSFFIFIAFFGLFSGCAFLGHKSQNEVHEIIKVPVPPAPVAGPVAPPPAALANNLGILQKTLEQVQQSVTPPMVLPHDRNDLGAYQKISIILPYADIWVNATAHQKHGRLHIDRTVNDDPPSSDCKVKILEKEGELQILEEQAPPLAQEATTPASSVPKSLKTDGLPALGDCHYSIELALSESSALSIDVRRGSVLVENWDEPVNVKMAWGDIDVGAIGPLTVSCGRCSLAGEGVSGTARYSMESGNVGLAGLTGTVEGETLGDAVLKWRKFNPGSYVKLLNRAGDVILSFPPNIGVAPEIEAPRGEVFLFSGKNKRSQKAGGIPINIHAEFGNVRFYRNGK